MNNSFIKVSSVVAENLTQLKSEAICGKVCDIYIDFTIEPLTLATFIIDKSLTQVALKPQKIEFISKGNV